MVSIRVKNKIPAEEKKNDAALKKEQRKKANEGRKGERIRKAVTIIGGLCSLQNL